jgi:sulfate transport system permease protein
MARTRHILPGFRFTLGYSIAYLSIIVLIPFAALAWKASNGGVEIFTDTLSDKRVLASLKLSFLTSFYAALVCGFFGVLTAWALERYTFPGRRLLDAMVDLPFALPTAVAGIALCTLYAPNGWLGQILSPGGLKTLYVGWTDNPLPWLVEFLEPIGFKAAYSATGITIALIFIGFPFVVRTVQPIIHGLSIEVEEAAACLGASRLQTIWKVVLPTILPGTLAGMTLAFGRAVGEYGSVVFIPGNMPFRTEIAPLLIVTRLEQYDYNGAAALGLILLVISFLILVVSNLLQAWNNRRTAR